jgi:hypothetical protein
MELLILLAGLLFGTVLTALCIMLTRKRFSSRLGALAVGLVATVAETYAALQLSLRLAEHYVRTYIEPQWQAQGHFDNGPSSFVAVGTLAMPFIGGALLGGIVASVVLAIRREAR